MEASYLKIHIHKMAKRAHTVVQRITNSEWTIIISHCCVEIAGGGYYFQTAWAYTSNDMVFKLLWAVFKFSMWVLSEGHRMPSCILGHVL